LRQGEVIRAGSLSGLRHAGFWLGKKAEERLIFGLAHSYQGWKAVLVISVLGMLYGVLAALRGNLRANIIAHASTDIFEGWLKFLMFPRWFPS
jgi:Type II CAAX prenyl endopeptidase Rce1-like